MVLFYANLLDGDPKYAAHAKRPTSDSTAWAILSPGVPVFRTDGGKLLHNPWLCSFITCAAPYSPTVVQRASRILLIQRIFRVLAIARAYRYTSLVLGAFSDVVFVSTDWSWETKRSVDQMNNNLISLLLQSLDSFRGILIFCSNFGFGDKGFDPAIHRRLHIISEVSSPSGEARVSILRHYFPELSGNEAEEFLVKYPFITPAQIRNLRKKYDVMLILGDGDSPVNELNELAERDLKTFRNGKRTIGYQIKTSCGEC